jgi:predicted NBD/HSP70 family sugar kinase
VAEHTWGAGVGASHLIYISSDVGVGGGIVIDGRPLVGAAGCAGEVGHVQVNPMGVRCRLPRTGISRRRSPGCCERRPGAIRWRSRLWARLAAGSARVLAA